MHPFEFAVNEAWIAFQLNDEPMLTEDQGAFHCIALMDAASCFILTNQFVPAGQPEPSELEARRLLKNGSEYAEQYPMRLLLPQGCFPGALTAEARKLGMTVEAVSEEELAPFIGEARQGFREFMDGREP